MRLADLKTQALRYVVLGDLAKAFRCYEAVVRAVPADLDARMKIADLLVTAQAPEQAKRVYAAIAFYDLQGGRPLPAVVACQALHELGAEVTQLYDSLALLYGAGSPKLAQGKVGARLSPPDPDADVPAPDLTLELPPSQAAHSAA